MFCSSSQKPKLVLFIPAWLSGDFSWFYRACAWLSEDFTEAFARAECHHWDLENRVGTQNQDQEFLLKCNCHLAHLLE